MQINWNRKTSLQSVGEPPKNLQSLRALKYLLTDHRHEEDGDVSLLFPTTAQAPPAMPLPSPPHDLIMIGRREARNVEKMCVFKKNANSVYKTHTVGHDVMLLNL